ncbi:hypothetical protein BRAS3843_1270033 [Bradyrhizobium sp. STM 3843]|nr:hypothetical protein BRAS3843_1270033 [Bradyrhizobium sp. STM 3843]
MPNRHLGDLLLNDTTSYRIDVGLDANKGSTRYRAQLVPSRGRYSAVLCMADAGTCICAGPRGGGRA